MKSRSIITIIVILVLAGVLYAVMRDSSDDVDPNDNGGQIEDTGDVTDNTDPTDNTDNTENGDTSDNTDNSGDVTDNTDNGDATDTTDEGDVYTLEEVQAHDSETDCYAVVDGSVYDLTAFIANHPGGEGAIKNLCGIDGTEEFAKIHGDSEKAKAALANLEIGTLQE